MVYLNSAQKAFMPDEHSIAPAISPGDGNLGPSAAFVKEQPPILQQYSIDKKWRPIYSLAP
jgi:hypothetical protein